MGIGPLGWKRQYEEDWPAPLNGIEIREKMTRKELSKLRKMVKDGDDFNKISDEFNDGDSMVSIYTLKAQIIRAYAQI